MTRLQRLSNHLVDAPSYTLPLREQGARVTTFPPLLLDGDQEQAPDIEAEAFEGLGLGDVSAALEFLDDDEPVEPFSCLRCRALILGGTHACGLLEVLDARTDWIARNGDRSPWVGRLASSGWNHEQGRGHACGAT